VSNNLRYFALSGIVHIQRLCNHIFPYSPIDLQHGRQVTQQSFTMPRQVPTSRTDPKCISAILMQEEMHYSSTVADPAPHLDLFRQDIDNRFEIGKVQELTLSVPEIAKVSSWDCHSEPITPTLLSPTSSASSSISTHEIGFTWDSPQTPQTPSRRKGHVNMDPATPLTPPEPLEDMSNNQVLMVELAYGTPSRTDCDDDEEEGNLKKHKQSSEIFQSGVRKFRPMIESRESRRIQVTTFAYTLCSHARRCSVPRRARLPTAPEFIVIEDRTTR
jgi:hypothetical protein